MPGIVIVGAGFGGIGMGIALKKAGYHDFVILDKAHDLGGTWRDNQYPGCACDVPSPLYSYSFELNPDWSHLFAPQREIWDYLRNCARKHGLEEHIRFGTAVERMDWDDAARRWHVETARALRDAIYLAMEARAVGFTISPRLMAPLEHMAVRHLRSQVTDPALRARLTPDYTIGCKRILLSSDYYPALQRPNVSLVTDHITGISETGVRTADGAEHPADVIIYGTGFKRRLRRAVWSEGGCASWYLDADGVNRTLWPGFTFEYWARTRRARHADYLVTGS